MKISIVIPLFNEEDNVIPLYERLTDVMAACPEVDTYELVMVDDGSTDATARRLASIADPRLKPVSMGTRQGQSAAFDRGIRAASYETIATLDGDLQNDPADLPAMVAILNQGSDFVQGWRTPREDPLPKRISSRIANTLRRWVLKDAFHDIACSQRVFKKECVSTVEFFRGAHRFLPYLVQQAGYRVTECKVKHHPRIAGISKYGLSNRLIGPLKDLIRISRAQKSRR
jgi:glycosyltransferase involved in cell wall biosynthesis